MKRLWCTTNMVERVAGNQRNRRGIGGCQHVQFRGINNFDRGHLEDFGAVMGFQRHPVTEPDVLERTEEPVAVSRDAEVARFTDAAGADNAGDPAIQIKVRGPVKNRHADVQVLDIEDGLRRGITRIPGVLVVRNTLCRPA